jgi:hypothetical protein
VAEATQIIPMNLYRAVDVWERDKEHAVVRYRCLESLSTGKFHVQSADFYRNGEGAGTSDQQFISFRRLIHLDVPRDMKLSEKPSKPTNGSSLDDHCRKIAISQVTGWDAPGSGQLTKSTC